MTFLHSPALLASHWVGRVALLILLLTVTPRSAPAQSAADRTTARSLAQEAQEAFDRGDFATAEDRFARAEALVHAPTLMLALARSQLQLGKLVQAYENYLRVMRETIPDNAPDVWKDAPAQAKTESDAVHPRLGWVTIVVRGASDPRVTLEDGTLIPKPALGVKRAVNPGEHSITASAPGFRTETTEFHIGEGQAIAITLSLEVDPNAPRPAGPAGISAPTWQAAGVEDGAQSSSSMKTWGYVGLGVGAAGVIAGSVAGALAISQHGELERQCPGGQCPVDQQNALDSYRSVGGLSTIAFAIGGIGTAAGVTLLLAAPSEAPASGVAGPSLRLRASLSRLTLEGRF